MTDRYQQLVNAPVGRQVAGALGLPKPLELERHGPGSPPVGSPVLIGGTPGARALEAVAGTIARAGASASTPMDQGVREACARAGLDASIFNPETAGDERFKVIVFDATAIGSSDELEALHRFFRGTIRRLRPCGRIVVLGTPPEHTGSPRQATAQRALEGFVRSVAKEARGGSTAQLAYVEPGAEELLESTIRFLGSARSAYVSGQVVRVGRSDASAQVDDWERPLAQRVALVTGAARGIGAAIADVLARDGATVVGLDVPAVADELRGRMHEIGGSGLEIDITESGAPRLIADHLETEHGGVDVVVHNAGITRDKTLGRMPEETWDKVIDINLSSEERIDDELLGRELLRKGGRIVCVSSISGIAGNAGQTNYATSKAGVIGMVESMASVLERHDATINAVAPGFIETQMTDAMPIATREAGRRMNSLSQGGRPVDVAETIAWLASPGSAGLNGNVVRVCGQSLIGA